jgi:hypothetical protein
MKCVITNLETNNKWKDVPICTEMVAEAKKVMIEREMSMRDALVFLQTAWNKQFKQKALDEASKNLKEKSAKKFGLKLIQKELETDESTKA